MTAARFSRSRARCAALALSLVALSGCAPRPNVVMLVVDTLRADHLGCYGYARPTSPNADRLAAEGVVFENAIASSSWTGPSIASLFTSLHPGVHGLTTLDARLPPRLRTLAEEFGGRGYATAGFSANFAVVTAQKGFAKGFDRFEELHRRTRPGEPDDLLGHVAAGAREVTDRALAWLREDPGAPFFLYLHYMDPHSGYDPPPAYLRQVGAREYDGAIDGSSEQITRAIRGELTLDERDRLRLVDLYDGEIAFADAEIGRLVDELRHRGLLERSIVALLADHGEEFLDHGGLLHGQTLYREQIRVPLVVRLPGGRSGGRRIGETVGVVDVGPTLLELAGAVDPREGQGRSRAALLRGDAPEGAAFAYSELDRDPMLEDHLRREARHRAAVTGARWSFLEGTSPGGELFDTTVDAPQRDDRALAHPEVAGAMRRRLASHLAGLPREEAAPRAPLDEGERERLRALGYLD